MVGQPLYLRSREVFRKKSFKYGAEVAGVHLGKKHLRKLKIEHLKLSRSNIVLLVLEFLPK